MKVCEKAMVREEKTQEEMRLQGGESPSGKRWCLTHKQLPVKCEQILKNGERLNLHMYLAGRLISGFCAVQIMIGVFQYSVPIFRFFPPALSCSFERFHCSTLCKQAQRQQRCSAPTSPPHFVSSQHNNVVLVASRVYWHMLPLLQRFHCIHSCPACPTHHVSDSTASSLHPFRTGKRRRLECHFRLQDMLIWSS